MKKILRVVLMVCCCFSLASCGASSSGADDAAAREAAAAVEPTPIPAEYLTQQSTPEVDEGLISECADLAVADGHVWRYTDGQVLCENPAADLDKMQVASLPVENLLSEGAKADFEAVVPWGDDSILLCLSELDGAGERKVELVELGLKDNKITELSRQDATDKLGQLMVVDVTADESGAASGDAWLEADVISVNQRLVIGVLDADFQMHFHLFDPAADKLTELGERPLDLFRSMVPYGDGVLIAEPDDFDEGALKLVKMSLPSGDVDEVCALQVSSVQRMYNFAYDDASEQLYFTTSNLVYAIKLADGAEPQVVGRFDAVPADFRVGALTSGRYACHGPEGELLACDVEGSLEIAELHVVDTQGIDLLVDAAADFGVAHPSNSVVITDSEEEELVGELESAPESCDAFAVRVGGGAWQNLMAGGYMAPLNSGDLLAAVQGDMPWRMRFALEKDGNLLGFPVSVESFCQSVNVPAMAKLAGIGVSDFPTDWAGFLQLLAKLADSGVLVNNEQYVLYGSDVDAEGLRETMLANVVQSCMLAIQDGKQPSEVRESFVAILKEFEKIDWTQLGLGAANDGATGSEAPDAGGNSGEEGKAEASKDADEASGMNFSGSDGRTPLMTDSLVELDVQDVAEGMQYWPLSVGAEGKRLVTQMLVAVCVNTRSANSEDAIAFVEHLWEKSSMTAKMMLCQSVNDPVPNEDYDTELAYHEKLIAKLEKQVGEAADDETKNSLQAQLDDVSAYTERYRQNAKWTATEQSIANYRALQDDFEPVGYTVWDDEHLVEGMYAYLDGGSSAEEFSETLMMSVA